LQRIKNFVSGAQKKLFYQIVSKSTTKKVTEPKASAATPDAEPTTKGITPEALANVAFIAKPCLWMLIDHFQFAINRGGISGLKTEDQLSVLQNVVTAKQALNGWEPQPQQPPATAPA